MKPDFTEFQTFLLCFNTWLKRKSLAKRKYHAMTYNNQVVDHGNGNNHLEACAFFEFLK